MEAAAAGRDQDQTSTGVVAVQGQVERRDDKASALKPTDGGRGEKVRGASSQRRSLTCLRRALAWRQDPELTEFRNPPWARSTLPLEPAKEFLPSPATEVSDALLEYLLFHELLHDLLPGRGHDTEFRRLEALWPDADSLDGELDELSEQLTLTSRH